MPAKASSITMAIRTHLELVDSALAESASRKSKLMAKSTVLRDFPGAYAQARYGFALGTASIGELWLQNNNGVIMHLKAKREGLMLSLGGDAVVIEMNQ
jgi:hypothetical protein